MREEMQRQDWGHLFDLIRRVWQENVLPQPGAMGLLCVGDEVFVERMPEDQPFGLTFYEGKEGLNHYFLSREAWETGLTPEYAYYSQRCLRCGYRPGKELSSEQQQLGIGAEVDGLWPTAVSFLPGYFPCAPDRVEGKRLIGYLETILRGEICPTENLPFESYQYGELELSDERLLRDLAAAPCTEAVLQADVAYMGVCANDPRLERPGNPMVYFLTDAGSGRKVNFEILEAGQDALLALASAVIRYIMEWGVPRTIRVPNSVVASVLTGICHVTGTELRIEKKALKNVERR